MQLDLVSIIRISRGLLISFLLLYVAGIMGQSNQLLTINDYLDLGFNQIDDAEDLKWAGDSHFRHIKGSDEDFIIKVENASGVHQDTLVRGGNIKYDMTSFERFDNYLVNASQTHLILIKDESFIYRRSTQGRYYLYHIKTGNITPLMQGEPIQYGTFSPDGERIAFVHQHNLKYYSIKDQKVHEVTTDGEQELLLHGQADWAYEEELTLTKAFEWSADSKKIGFMSFDVRDMKQYYLPKWEGVYPDYEVFAYPKAGYDNAKVSIRVYHCDAKTLTTMDTGSDTDIYLPRIFWLPSNQLAFIRLNRLQNKQDILFADINTGKSKLQYTIQSDTYIDFNANETFYFLADRFFFTSANNGYKHIYMKEYAKKEAMQITKGEWEVIQFSGINTSMKKIFFTSNQHATHQNHLYEIGFEGKNKKKLTEEPGYYEANFDPTGSFYTLTYSHAKKPNQVVLKRVDQREVIDVLVDNKELTEKLSSFQIPDRSFITIEVNDVELKGYMIKPPGFDESKKYPVLMYVYGGPGSQIVVDKFEYNRPTRVFRDIIMSQAGYIVYCFDNRGTGGRGKVFEDQVYKHLGELESDDQIALAKKLGALPYVDKDRIGIWGWSYGGYLSALSMFRGEGVFKAAISVAPVTDWQLYDNIYTERYMQRPKDNPAGYHSFAPIHHYEKLSGAFLLVHGMADDNVHHQHSIALQHKLIEANKPFQCVYLPGQNHRMDKGNAMRYLLNMMKDFIINEL